MFTNEELKNLQVFLGRVQLTGSEALVLVLLQQKIMELLTPKSDEKGSKSK